MTVEPVEMSRDDCRGALLFLAFAADWQSASNCV
jgi:hypothetical protein